MRTIVKSTGIVASILHTTRIKAQDYRISSFVITEPVEDGCLLCNTITGELLALNFDEMEFVNNGLAIDKLPELIYHRFWVPQNYNDVGIISQIRQAVTAMQPNNSIVRYNFLPTTCCNAKCFYCYQHGYQHHTMNNQTVKKAFQFIKAHCGGKKIHLNWFGGQPLVAYNYISQLCDLLLQEHIEYTSSMTSNGSLFTPDLVTVAQKKWHLKKVQITLDGTEEIYNSIKSYINPNYNPYERVLHNIQMLCKAAVQVSIRLNLHLENAENLVDLVDELARRFSDNKEYLHVYVHTLFGGVGSNPLNYQQEQIKVLSQKQYLLEKIIQQNGLAHKAETSLPHIRTHYCMADNGHSIQIGPDGSLTMCEHYIDEYQVGTLDEGITNTDEVSKWRETVIWDECEGCPLVPYCLHLKKCPVEDRCYSWQKETKIQRVKRLMRKLYKEYVEKETIQYETNV